MTQIACKVRSLTVSYHLERIIEDVSFELPKSSLLGIIGPNGAGKSTLLKGMLGLAPKISGQTLIFEKPLSKVRSRVSYIPQNLTLDLTFPVTVLDVVLMGTYPKLGWIKRPKREHAKLAIEALEQVGLADSCKQHFGELSGGQRQRVLLARALVQKPDLLLMDEPFQGVDASSERNIIEVLHALRDEGASIIMVHHDLATVHDYCDRALLLNKKLIAYGETSEVFTPDNLEALYGLPAKAFRRGA